MKKIFLIGIFLLAMLFFCMNIEAFEVPKFKIMWKDGTTFGILFEQKLSDVQIEQVIYEFREIRKRNEFHKYFPPVLPHLKDKYAVIQIQIFTDSKWATETMEKDFVNERMSKKMEKQYVNNIKGYYAWQKLSDNKGSFERGTLGDAEGKIMSKNYKELFKLGKSIAD